MSKLFYVAVSFLLTAITATMFIGMREASPAFGGTPTLDGFDIQTGENQVVVTLYTDERANFKTETTENNGTKQFAIILPKAQLSDTQINNGMPVVMDNQKKFIGRAVPTQDGQVKILLPNIPVEHYAISVRQQAAGQKAAPADIEPMQIAQAPSSNATLNNETMNLAALADTIGPQAPNPNNTATRGRSAIEPRPAVLSLDSRFESLASDFESTPATANRVTSKPGTKTAARPTVTTTERKAATPQNGTVENPYVSSLLRNPPRPNYLPAPNESANQQPVTTLSMADSVKGLGAMESYPMATSANNKDPLWYLHALQPFDPGQGLSSDGLQAAAQQDQATMASKLTLSSSQAIQAPGATVVAYQNPFDGLIEAVQKLPKWLTIMIALFIGGIGLFAALGSVLVARQLWAMLRTRPEQQAQFLYNGMVPGLGLNAVGLAQQYGLAVPMGVHEAEKNPEKAESVTTFADTSSINAMDYLSGKHPADKASAPTLLKFPSSRKSRMRTTSKPGMTRRFGNQ